MVFSVSGVVLVVLFFIGLYIFLNNQRVEKRKGFPPGPRLKFPLLGHLPLISGYAHVTFLEWSKKYGNILGVQLGSFRSVIIHDHKLIREVMNDVAFSGRPDMKFINEPLGGKKGIFAADGKSFLEQKRFIMKNLLNVDFTKKKAENLIQQDVSELLAYLSIVAGQPIGNLHSKLSTAVLNAVWAFVTGKRYTHDDKRLSDLVWKCSQFSGTSCNAAVIFMPWIGKFAPTLSGWKHLMTGVSEAIKYFSDFIEEHRTTLDENNPRDFIDLYLIKINRTVDPNSGFYGEEGKKNLVAVLTDIFTAGSETVSVALLWAFLYITYYPEVQEKLHQEIDLFIGKRQATISDRTKMPYTEAIMAEVFRHSAMLPMSAFHNTMQDVVFQGYEIPKDTLVLCNNYSAQYDQSIWGDPDNFRPERFMDTADCDVTDGKKLDAIFAFSSGKRACLGEALAKAEFFLFLVGAYQRFRCQFEGELPTLEPKNALIMAPHPYKIIFHERMKSSISPSNI